MSVCTLWDLCLATGPTIRGYQGTIRGPMTAKVIISNPSEYQDHSDHQGSSYHQGPSDHKAPLTIRSLPNSQAPLNIRGPIMGRFKLWSLKIPAFHFSFFIFVVEFGPLPKNSGPNTRIFSFG